MTAHIVGTIEFLFYLLAIFFMVAGITNASSDDDKGVAHFLSWVFIVSAILGAYVWGWNS